MNIIFLGKPFSGKGTQSKLIGERLNLPAISMGRLLREAYKKNPQENNSWWGTYAQGLNVPTGVKIPLLENELNKIGEGFVLDNFPATMEDLQFLEEYLRKVNKKIDHVFYLKISDETVEERRRIVRGREDDEPTIVQRRLEAEFKHDLQPVLNYFKKQGILEEVGGERSVTEVHQDILGRLGIDS